MGNRQQKISEGEQQEYFWRSKRGM